jgi:cyanocobalamin reductase (cyanide-eliminating) / alkylcobalamin dealkylase
LHLPPASHSSLWPSALLDGVTGELTQAGFALHSVFGVTAELRAMFPFPMLGVECPLGLLVANDRQLWPHIEARVHAGAIAHPLDSYVEATLQRILAGEALVGVPHACFLGWRMDYPGHDQKPTAIPLQRLAQAIGFAALGPAHLSVHPEVGPWLALRAVIVLGVEVKGHVPLSTPRREPCASCAAPCVAPFETARAQDRAALDGWRSWLAVRDACPVGRVARYDEAQIRYHYTGAFASAHKP